MIVCVALATEGACVQDAITTVVGRTAMHAVPSTPVLNFRSTDPDAVVHQPPNPTLRRQWAAGVGRAPAGTAPDVESAADGRVRHIVGPAGERKERPRARGGGPTVPRKPNVGGVVAAVTPGVVVQGHVRLGAVELEVSVEDVAWGIRPVRSEEGVGVQVGRHPRGPLVDGKDGAVLDVPHDRAGVEGGVEGARTGVQRNDSAIVGHFDGRQPVGLIGGPHSDRIESTPQIAAEPPSEFSHCA